MVTMMIIIHSFNFIVVCFLFSVFFARLVLCLICLLVSSVCVCMYEIRLSIELMDVMTSGTVMLLYVNIVTQSHRVQADR